MALYSLAYIMTEKDWDAFAYEVWMLRSARALLPTFSSPGPLNNALTESYLLHARIVIEALVSNARDLRYPDDVILSDLVAVRTPDLQSMIRDLRAAYGAAKDRASTCWMLNKRLAHLTTHRGGAGFDYSEGMSRVEPLIDRAIAAIESAAGKKFPAASLGDAAREQMMRSQLGIVPGSARFAGE
jgi:hypothetical protein